MGVSTELAIALWKGYWRAGEEQDDEVKPLVHRAVRLNWHQADILLWNQIAHDIGVTPQAPIKTKLVDVERSVSVDAYDDRGMDIIALDSETIFDLHSRFDSWLLDYDRVRMLEAFQS